MRCSLAVIIVNSIWFYIVVETNKFYTFVKDFFTTNHFGTHIISYIRYYVIIGSSK